MGFLSVEQTAAIKAIRSRAWNQPFEVHTYTVDGQIDNFYDALTTGDPVIELVSGDWRWEQQMDRTYRPGGWVEGADLYLACDIVHVGKFLNKEAVRIKVDDTLCAIIATTQYTGSGEVVLHAKKIREEGG